MNHYLVAASLICPSAVQLWAPALLHLTAGHEHISLGLGVCFHFVLCAALTSLPSFSGATLIKSSMLNPGKQIKINLKIQDSSLKISTDSVAS